jgi:signal transduction histidine kinase
MRPSAAPASRINTTNNLLLAYVADLELEVDRLRNQAQFVRREVRGSLRRVRGLCTNPVMPEDAISQISHSTSQLAEVLGDLYEPPGYHPAHDQVIAIAIRPLVEQLFRWQQRLTGAEQAVLRLELESDHVEWFPARLRHILDNMISNALKYRDPGDEAVVRLGLTITAERIEFRMEDNGLGVPPGEYQQGLAIFYRSAPTRAAGLGVGLSVVRFLVEQSGGDLSVEDRPEKGTVVVARLPRFDLEDFLL